MKKHQLALSKSIPIVVLLMLFGIPFAIAAALNPHNVPPFETLSGLQLPSVSLSGAITLTVNFNGADARVPVNWPAADPDIAVGPTKVIVITNDIMAIRNKTGTLVASKDLREFFNSVVSTNENGFDPGAEYDPLGNRFFLSATGFVDNPNCIPPGSCISHVFLAVSKTSNPTSLEASDWHFYALDSTLIGTTPAATASDFPHISVIGEFLVITWQRSGFSGTGGQGAQIRLVNKSTLMSGQPVTTWIDFTVPFRSVILPAITFGDIEPIFLVHYFDPCTSGSTVVEIWAISNLAVSPTLTSHSVDLGGTCGTPPDAPQQGGGTPLDVIEWNAQPVYRNGSLWVARAVVQNYGSGNVSAIRWAQINVTGWPDTLTVVHDGTFGLDGIWHFEPTVMVDASNNLAVLFARSSTNEFASLYYTGRLAVDSPNTVRQSALLKAGVANLQLFDNGGSVNRYGDYFGAAVDPVDGSIWMYGEYAKASNQWGTWVGNIVFANYPRLYLPIMFK